MTATSPQSELLPALDSAALIARYARGVENFDPRALKLADNQLDTAFLPEAGVGRWPVRVLLGHLADSELVQAHRVRRTVAEDNPVFSVWDENAFTQSGLYGDPATGSKHPIGAFVATIHTLRRWTSEWLKTLTPEQWGRAALHPEKGPQTVRSLVESTTWHLEHHADFLNRKVARMLAGTEPGAH